MSSVLQTTGSSQYVEPDAYIDFQLEKTRSGVKSADILTASVGSLTLLLGYLLAFVVFDHWVIPGGFGVGMRVVLLGGVLVTCGTWIALGVVIPYLRRVNSLYAARLIEQSNPDLRSTLINLVDLDESGRAISEPVRNTLEKRAAVALSRTDVDLAIDRRPLMRIMYVLLGIVVVGCLYTVLTPKKIAPSIYRALLPTADAAVATRTEILDVKPGDVEVLARSQVEVIVDLSGQAPERVSLLYSTADRKFVDAEVEMQPIEEGVKQYRTLLSGENGRGILQDMTYRIVAGDTASREFRITVQQPPSARVDAVKYEFPEYMGFEPKSEPGGTIEGWEGTQVTVEATANMPVKSALILFSDTEDVTQKAEEVRMEITDGTRLRGTWTLAFRNDESSSYAKFYRVQVKSEKGDVDPQPTLHAVTIRPDKKPEVLLLDPKGDLEKPANAVVPLMISARDDFLLKSVRVKVQKNGQDVPFDGTVLERPQPILAPTPPFLLKLEALNVKAGDTVTYWVEARDNRSTARNREGQVVNTPKLSVKVVEPVAPQEAKRQLDEDRQRQDEKLEELKQQAAEDAAKDPPPQGDEDRPQPKAGDRADRQEEGQRGEAPRDRNREQGQEGRKQEGEDRQRGENGEDRERRREDGQGEKGQPEPGKQGGQKSDGTQKGGGQKAERGEGEPSGNGTEGAPDANRSQDKLKTDGADDDAALQKILDRERQKQAERKKQDEGSGENGSEQNGTENKPSPKGDDPTNTNDPKRGGDPRQDDAKTNDTKPGRDKPQGAKDKSGDDPKNGSDPSGDSPENKSASDGKSDSPGKPNSQGKSANDPKSNPMADDSKSGKGTQSPPKPGEGDAKEDASKSTDPKSSDPKANGAKPEGGKPDASKKGDPKADPSGKKEGDGSAADKKTGAEKSGDKTGKGKNDDDKGTESKSDGGKPMNGGQPMPGENGTDPKSDAGKPGDPKANDPKNGSKAGNGRQTDEAKKPGEGKRAGTEDKPGNDPKPGEPKPGDADQGSEKANGAKPMGKSGDGTKPDATKPDGTEPDGKKPEAGKEGNSDKGDKPMPAAGDMNDSKPKDGKSGTEKGAPGDRPMPGGKPKPDDKPMPGGTKGESDANDGKSPDENSSDGKGADGKDAEGKKPGAKPSTEKTKEGSAGDGEETPSDDKGPANKKKGTGKEKGPASASDDPDAEAKRAENKLERKDPNEKGARRPSDETDPEKADRRDDEKTGRKPSARKRNERPEDPQPNEPENAAGSKEADPKGKPGANSKPKTQSGDGKEGNEAEGKEGEGKPQPGKPDRSKSGRSNTGDPSDDAADQKPSPGGKPKPGEGKPGDPSRSKPSPDGSEAEPSDDGKQGEASDGKPGDGKSGKSKPGQGKPGEGKPGESDGEPSGDSGSSPSGAAANGKTGMGGDQSGGSGRDGGAGAGGEGGDTPDEANPEDARKAANLVLRKLEDQIQRGDVDPELLKELGWTKDDMRRFADRLKNQLEDRGDDGSPGAVARRRQFEESLKNLDLRSGAKSRRGANFEKPDNDAAIGPRKAAVPSEYRDAYEAYTREVSKRTTPSASDRSPRPKAPAKPSGGK